MVELVTGEEGERVQDAITESNLTLEDEMKTPSAVGSEGRRGRAMTTPPPYFLRQQRKNSV